VSLPLTLPERETNPGLPAGAPAPAPQRIATIDFLRGLALLGILIVNITTFRSGAPAWSGVDRAVDGLILALLQGKFILMYSFLFGLGFALQLERAADRPFAARYYRRLLGLLLFGVAHYVLLWEGDILLSYVVPGLLLMLFARRRPQTALRWGVGLYAAYVAFLAVILVVAAGRAPAANAAASVAAAAEPGSVPPDLLLKGSYAALVAIRWRILPEGVSEHILGVVYALGIFLVGFYTGRQRFLSDWANHRPGLRRTLVWGLGVGLVTAPAYVALSLILKTLTWPLQILLMAAALVSPMALCLAYIAGATLAAPGVARRWPWLAAGMQAAGRMSLSNYLLQSVILTTLFYGYGLGWYNRVGPVAGVALAAVIYAGQLVLSVWWLKVFRFGPAEWVWRSLTYWRVQPVRRGR
jgi:uncharacterized protein